MGYHIQTWSRSPVTVEAQEWLYEHPEGARLTYRDGKLAENTSPWDYQTLKHLAEGGYAHRNGHRPTRFTKANSAGQEHVVAFKLDTPTRMAMTRLRETPPAILAAEAIGDIVRLHEDAVGRELRAAIDWLRLKAWQEDQALQSARLDAEASELMAKVAAHEAGKESRA